MLCEFSLFVAVVPLRHQQSGALVTQPVTVGTDSMAAGLRQRRISLLHLQSACSFLMIYSLLSLFPHLRGATKCETSTILLIL